MLDGAATEDAMLTEAGGVEASGVDALAVFIPEALCVGKLNTSFMSGRTYS